MRFDLIRKALFVFVMVFFILAFNKVYAAPPGPPTNVMAVGGYWPAWVEFTAPVDDGGSVITGYLVTSNPGFITAAGPSSPIQVTGLASGTEYSFSVVAVNADGSSMPVESNSVMVTAPFDPPTIVNVAVGNTFATITFEPPPGYTDFTGYRVTSSGGHTVTATQSPITVPGLTNGTSYSFSVTAITSGGESLPSFPSGTVTPSAGSADQGNGPYGGAVQCLAVDPLSSGTVYAGTYGGGVHKTSDGGSTWTAVNSGMSATDVRALAIDPTSNQTVFAGTATGVFKTVNGGVSWTNGGLGLAVRSLVIDPTTTQVIYAGTSSGVYKTTNGGNNWAAASTGLPAAEVTALAVDPASTGTVYAAIKDTGLYKTTDGGASWSAKTSGSFLSSVAINPGHSQTIYAGSWGDIIKSTDGGSTWKGLYPAGCLESSSLVGSIIICSSPSPLNFHSVVIDPIRGETVFAGTSESLLKSTNGGSSWETMISGTEVLSVTMPSNGENVYIGTATGAAFKVANSPSIPAPPAAVTATAGNGQATIEFTPPTDDGGSDISNYIVASTPGNIAASGTSSPITVTGLSNGTSYTFTVVAVNSAGESGKSYSNSVTPKASYAVVPALSGHATIFPETTQTVVERMTTTFTVTPESGYGAIVTGCGGALVGTTYTTEEITGNCMVTVFGVRRSGSTSGNPPTVLDAIKVLRAALGLSNPTPEEKIAYDVAPLGPTGSPVGNGTLDIADIILILRRSIGIGSW